MSLPTASYSQALLPTSPSHAVSCNLSPTGGHLVTVRDDTLQVWQVTPKGKLHHLLTQTFFGTITGLLAMQTLESESDGCQRLIVSFKDAKLALLEWNDEAQELETVSIHTYERTPQVAQGLPNHFRPILSQDPEGRCATLLLPQDSLAVLPLISSSDLALLDDEEDDLYNDGPNGNGYGANASGPSYRNGNSSEERRRLPYTPSFVLPFSEVDPSIRNVRDVALLPNFQKPTIAVLCEPQEQAWTGSLGVRRDTMHIFIFTLDLSSTTHPVLSQVADLPYDAMYLVASPPSLGGVFVVTPSSLFHVDQSGRLVGLRVNGWAEMTTMNSEVRRFPLHSEREGGQQLDLCDSHIAWSEGMELTLLDSEARGGKTKPSAGSGFLVLKDGQVFGIRCALDGRTLSGLSLHPANQVPPLAPSSAVLSLSHCEALFVASMLGESSLVGIGARRATVGQKEEDETDSKAKQQQQSAMDLDEEDDALYGDSAVPSTSTAAATAAATSSGSTHLDYTLSLLDTLPGLGPLSDLTLSVLPSSDGSGDDVVKLVATHGVAPHGGLVHIEDVLQPRKRRAVVLHSRQRQHEGMTIPALDNVRRVAPGRYLGVNPLVGTPTLYAIEGEGRAEVLMEFWDEKVKAVGWLGLSDAGRERYLVVSESSIVVRSIAVDDEDDQAQDQEDAARQTELAGTARQVVLGLDESNDRIVSTIAARLEDGRVQILVVDAAGKAHQIALLDSQAYTRIALFTDETSTFSRSAAATPGPSSSDLTSRRQAMDEDEVDYGDEDLPNAASSAQIALPEPTHHLALISSSGGLELFTLSGKEGAQRQWRSNSIMDLPAQLEPLSGSEEDEPVITCSETVDVQEDVDDLWVGVVGDIEEEEGGAHSSLCVALAERSGLLNVWVARKTSSGSFVFNKKLARQLSGLDDSEDSEGGAASTMLPPDGEIASRIPHRIIETTTPGTAGGRRLFVTGPSKTGWLVKPRKGRLQFFASAHRRVRGLAPFDDVADEDEEYDPDPERVASPTRPMYIISDTHGLSLCRFPPSDLRYDLDLPYTLHSTGRQYTHVRPFPTLRALVTASVNRTQFVQFDTEDMSIVRPLEYDPTPAYSTRGALELFRRDMGAPVDGYEFEQNETITALELVTLHSSSTATGLKDFIAVGTSVFNGEDRPTRGGMYIFDVVETVSDPSDPVVGSNARLKLLVKDDAKGPVTACGDISGYFVVSIGQRLFVRALEKEEVLINVAFLDVGFLSTSLRRLGSTLLIADVRRAVLFAGFQEDPFRLTVFARQFPGVEAEMAGGGYATAAEYLVSEEGLGFVAADWRGVLRLLEYPAAKAVAEASGEGGAQPATAADGGGGSSSSSRLHVRTEFQTSATEFTGSLSRAPAALVYGGGRDAAETGADGSASSSAIALRNEAVLATSSGSLVIVRPLTHHGQSSSHPSAALVASLSNSMQRLVPHAAALPPRGARLVAGKVSGAARPLNRGMLDGGVLEGEWLMMCSRVKREELAGVVRGTIAGQGNQEAEAGDGGFSEERLRRAIAGLFA